MSGIAVYVDVDDLRRTIMDTQVVAGVGFTEQLGERFGLFGANRAGKTTADHIHYCD